MRSVGKIRSFKISRRLVFWSIIFFITYIITSIYFINDWVDKRRIKNDHSEKIKLLETDLLKSKKERVRSRQRLALLEDYIRNIEERREQESQPSKSKDLKEMEPAPSVETPPKEVIEEEKPEKIVNIKDMVIQKDGSRMTLDLKLVNLNPGENAVGGYIHIIAIGKNTNPPLEWTHPKEKLQNGVPVNYRRGLPFLIQRFKPYHFQFNSDSNSKLPTIIKVLVYSQSGELILEKEFEVSNVS